MNGHSRNSVVDDEYRQVNNDLVIPIAALADSGIKKINLSTALKRFFSSLDYFNVSKKTACASHPSLSCNSSNLRSYCSDNCKNNNNDNFNNSLYTNTSIDVNVHTALVSNNDCMSKSLDHNSIAYCNSQPSTSNATSLIQRQQRQYKYSVY